MSRILILLKAEEFFHRRPGFRGVPFPLSDNHSNHHGVGVDKKTCRNHPNPICLGDLLLYIQENRKSDRLALDEPLDPLLILSIDGYQKNRNLVFLPLREFVD